MATISSLRREISELKAAAGKRDKIVIVDDWAYRLYRGNRRREEDLEAYNQKLQEITGVKIDFFEKEKHAFDCFRRNHTPTEAERQEKARLEYLWNLEQEHLELFILPPGDDLGEPMSDEKLERVHRNMAEKALNRLDEYIKSIGETHIPNFTIVNR